MEASNFLTSMEVCPPESPFVCFFLWSELLLRSQNITWCMLSELLLRSQNHMSSSGSRFGFCLWMQNIGDPTNFNYAGEDPTRTWQRKLDDEGKKVAMFTPTMNDIIAIGPLILKMLRLHVEDTAKGLASVYDPLRKWMDNCYRGVPLGGLGAGSIRQSYRGYFQHFQIFPMTYEEKPILANQFSAFVLRPNGEKYSTVLSAPTADVLKGISKAGIGSWDWKLKEKNCTYHGLFPRSWTVYDGEPDPEIKITCRQISPFIPNNYKESSFPVAVFTFTVQNSGSTPADVTLLFTWASLHNCCTWSVLEALSNWVVP